MSRLSCRTLFRLVAALPAVIIAGAAHAAGECPKRNLDIDYRLDTVFAEPAFDNTKPKVWIESQVGGNPNTRAQTKTHLATNVSLGFTFLPHPNGRDTCAYVNKAHFKLGFDHVDVFIAQQFRPGTCQYANLIEHERQHVAIARTMLERHRPAIDSALAAEVRRVGPVSAGDRKSAGDAIGQRLSQAFKLEWKKFEAAHSGAQAAIDTKESYRALEALCPRW